MRRILAIFCLLVPSLAVAESRVWELVSEGRRYHLVMLEKGGSEDPAFREGVYKRAENFMIEEYIARGTLDPARDKAMVEALRTTESIQDGRSHLLTIFEAEGDAPFRGLADLGKPRAMIRVAHQTEEKMLLPFEERLAARGLRELSPQRIEEGKSIALPGPLEFAEGRLRPAVYRQETGAVGAKVEMKNFVIAKDAKEGFFPLVMRLIEGAGWVSESELKTRATPRVFFGAGGTRVIPEPPGLPPAKPVHVSELYLETGVGRLQRYYERLGFETVKILEKDPDIAGNSTALMRFTREKLRSFLEYAERRTGPGDLLHSGRFRALELPRLHGFRLGSCSASYASF